MDYEKANARDTIANANCAEGLRILSHTHAAETEKVCGTKKQRDKKMETPKYRECVGWREAAFDQPARSFQTDSGAYPVGRVDHENNS
eukprot:2695618-Rhodomonas_salina.1